MSYIGFYIKHSFMKDLEWENGLGLSLRVSWEAMISTKLEERENMGKPLNSPAFLQPSHKLLKAPFEIS